MDEPFLAAFLLSLRRIKHFNVDGTLGFGLGDVEREGEDGDLGSGDLFDDTL